MQEYKGLQATYTATDKHNELEIVWCVACAVMGYYGVAEAETQLHKLTYGKDVDAAKQSTVLAPSCKNESPSFAFCSWNSNTDSLGKSPRTMKQYFTLTKQCGDPRHQSACYESAFCFSIVAKKLQHIEHFEYRPKMATETVTQTNGAHLNGIHTNGTISGPAFPDDVPTAPLLQLSFAKLQDNDPTEINRLIRACEDLGFFYLDLSGPGDNILADANKLFQVGEELYDLPLEEKQKYDFMHKNSYFGYKGYGANVVDKTGRTDRNEFYNVSKDDILDIGEKLPAPIVLDTQRPLFKSFMTSSHSIITMILNHLNTHLDLPPNTLSNLHRLKASSGDQVRLIKAPPQPIDDRALTLGEHTDFGSVTVLFNRLGGLQVLPPGKDAQWCYVQPLPGHAIINLGDAMAKFTNGLLRSNIHRVVSPPGAQADFTRYSLVYFSRPENTVLMKRLGGSSKIPALAEGEEVEEINAKDWVIRRALGHRHAINKEKAMDFESFQGTERLSRREGR